MLLYYLVKDECQKHATGKMVDQVIRPIRLGLLSSKMQNSRNNLLRTETATNRSCVNRQINLVYYQLISNCCRPVLTY